jgi:hypothetical protein
VTNRRTLAVHELADTAAGYRAALQGAVADAAVGRRSPATMFALAVEGARLRERLLGLGGPVAPADGRVAIHHDTDALGMMTLPWAGLYDGDLPAGTGLAACTDAVANRFACTSHEDGVVCPSLFWGLRYEIVSPSGWTPGTFESYGLFAWRRRLRRGQGPTDVLAWRVPNRRPVHVLLAGGAPDLDLEGHAAELRSIGHVELNVVDTVEDLRGALTGPDRYDVLYFFTHHGDYAGAAPTEGVTAVERQSQALELDRPLDDRELRAMLGAHRWPNGPVVVINACDSGVVHPDAQQNLLEQFRHAGARAIVVTETKVVPEVAGAAGVALLTGLFEGVPLDRVLVAARRTEFSEQGRLALLAYTVYGPPGLRFATAVISPKAPVGRHSVEAG